MLFSTTCVLPLSHWGRGGKRVKQARKRGNRNSVAWLTTIVAEGGSDRENGGVPGAVVAVVAASR